VSPSPRQTAKPHHLLLLPSNSEDLQKESLGRALDLLSLRLLLLGRRHARQTSSGSLLLDLVLGEGLLDRP
jgi:hypothetical protein